jgi:hypothetical protein
VDEALLEKEVQCPEDRSTPNGGDPVVHGVNQLLGCDIRISTCEHFEHNAPRAGHSVPRRAKPLKDFVSPICFRLQR